MALLRQVLLGGFLLLFPVNSQARVCDESNMYCAEACDSESLYCAGGFVCSTHNPKCILVSFPPESGEGVNEAVWVNHTTPIPEGAIIFREELDASNWYARMNPSKERRKDQLIGAAIIVFCWGLAFLILWRSYRKSQENNS